MRTSKKLEQFNIWIKEHFDLPLTVINPTVTANWLTGFVDGDGSFFIKISKHSPHYGAFNDTNRGSIRLTVEEIRAVKVTSFTVAV